VRLDVEVSSSTLVQCYRWNIYTGCTEKHINETIKKPIKTIKHKRYKIIRVFRKHKVCAAEYVGGV
jgi:hypothetical protein